MIDRLSGKVLEKKTDAIVVEVGGFGLLVHLTGSNVGQLDEGDDVVLYTYLQVKDDGFSLFGFLDERDRALFLLLIGVSGVGPKVALGIFTRFSSEEVLCFIQHGDVKSLTEAPGIGKKTAERLILELKDKIKQPYLAKSASNVSTAPSLGPWREAVEALIGLGYSSNEAKDAVKGVDSDDVEFILKTALRRLAMKG